MWLAIGCIALVGIVLFFVVSGGCGGCGGSDGYQSNTEQQHNIETDVGGLTGSVVVAPVEYNKPEDEFSGLTDTTQYSGAPLTGMMSEEDMEFVGFAAGPGVYSGYETGRHFTENGAY